MFVLFIFTAFRMPFLTIADELADHEVRTGRASYNKASS
jgi:hypothetical protein